MLTKRQVVFDFFIFSAGVFLNFSGYVVLLGLQSSINIENGAGKCFKYQNHDFVYYNSFIKLALILNIVLLTKFFKQN